MAPASAGEVVSPGQACEADCVAVEWVGTPSPREDPRVIHALLTGSLTERQAKVLEAAEAKAIRPVPGRRIRRTLMDDGASTDLRGLSMRYSWGPVTGMYVIAVRKRDVDIILGSASGYQFRLASEPGPRLLLPRRDPVRVVSRETFRTVDEFRRALEA